MSTMKSFIAMWINMGLLILVASLGPFLFLEQIGIARLIDYALEKTMAREQVIVQKIGDKIEYHLKKYKMDILLLRTLPAFRKFIVTRLSGEGTDLQQTKEDTEQMFVNLALIDETYYQLRYIDKTGKEAIRIDKVRNMVYFATEDRLQYKGDRDYFTKAIKPGASSRYTYPRQI